MAREATATGQTRISLLKRLHHLATLMNKVLLLVHFSEE